MVQFREVHSLDWWMTQLSGSVTLFFFLKIKISNDAVHYFWKYYRWKKRKHIYLFCLGFPDIENKLTSHACNLCSCCWNGTAQGCAFLLRFCAPGCSCSCWGWRWTFLEELLKVRLLGLLKAISLELEVRRILRLSLKTTIRAPVGRYPTRIQLFAPSTPNSMSLRRYITLL